MPIQHDTFVAIIGRPVASLHRLTRPWLCLQLAIAMVLLVVGYADMNVDF